MRTAEGERKRTCREVTGRSFAGIRVVGRGREAVESRRGGRGGRGVAGGRRGREAVESRRGGRGGRGVAGGSRGRGVGRGIRSGGLPLVALHGLAEACAVVAAEQADAAAALHAEAVVHAHQEPHVVLALLAVLRLVVELGVRQGREVGGGAACVHTRRRATRL